MKDSSTVQRGRHYHMGTGKAHRHFLMFHRLPWPLRAFGGGGLELEKAPVD